MRDFSRIVRNATEKFLSTKGFTYFEGKFVKECPEGVRIVIAFDNGGIDNDSFNIAIFVNSVALDSAQGAYCVTYYTGGSLSKNPRKLPCKNKDVLVGRIERFITNYDETIESYLSQFRSCSDIADRLANIPSLSGYRGELYFISGEKGKAKKEFKAWLAYIPTMKHVDAKSASDAIISTKQRIKQCGLFSAPNKWFKSFASLSGTG